MKEAKTQKSEEEWKKELTPEQYGVLRKKGTEASFSGKLLYNKKKGEYMCAACGNKIFSSKTKYDSDCGWPSFDDEIPGAVKRLPDPDGRRTEIQCTNCGAHLGHVFSGEHFTEKDTRHCVNSMSMDFIPDQ